MAWYFFYQRQPETDWIVALASAREKIVKDEQPAFTTALDVDNDFSSEMTAEDLAAVRFTGDLYFDFDSTDLDVVIPKFKEFLGKLTDLGVSLEATGLWATGGKGFHVTLPSSVFMQKPSPRGTLGLPAIYKEMAMEVFVDTLDLRVYTARRGRMFRTANVKRTNGKYKVPITKAEALVMTSESYLALTSAPRHLPPPEPAQYNVQVALLYEKAKDKVERALANRKKSRVDQNLLRRFKGEWPETLQRAMAGEGLAEGVGFQKIATQLAITAHALGKTEDALVAACSGLIDNHVSDGKRYNTPKKREVELRRMWQYMHENPCYEFSVGGVKSLLSRDVNTDDLEGDAGAAPGESETGDDEPQDFGTTLGMRINQRGVFKRTDEGLVRCCAVGMSNPVALQDINTGRSIGYEVDVFLDNKPQGRHLLGMDTFHSRHKFQQFTLGFGVSVQATDNQVGAMADIMRHKTNKDGGCVLVTGREGLDLIIPPDAKDRDDIDLAWITNTHVVSRNGVSYRLKGFVTREGEYKSDLYGAEPLQDDQAAIEYFEHLFNINSESVMARMFGWFTACFLRQVFHHFFKQFPIMQVAGEAGAGKSQTCVLLARMHFLHREPPAPGASDMTTFALQGMASGSSSIPLLIDESKWREMPKHRKDQITNALRGSYIRMHIRKGDLGRDSGETQAYIRQTMYSAPIAFLSEALESQPAILERSVVVSMTKASRDGRKASFDAAVEGQVNHYWLSRFGRTCVDRALTLDFDRFQAEVKANVALVDAALGARAGGADRPVFNIAVVLTGLEFARKVLGTVFGTHFDQKMEALKSSLLGNIDVIVPRTMSELAKVLNALAFLSKNEPTESPMRVQYGVDYTAQPDGTIDLKVRSCYAKYSRWCRTVGQELLFDNEEAFINALANYRGTIDRACTSNEHLYDGPYTKVFKVKVAEMDTDSVEHFYEPA